MSYHKHTFPMQIELTDSLKAHGLEHDTPSQLADAFRLGWKARDALVTPCPTALDHFIADVEASGDGK